MKGKVSHESPACLKKARNESTVALYTYNEAELRRLTRESRGRIGKTVATMTQTVSLRYLPKSPHPPSPAAFTKTAKFSMKDVL